MGLLTDSENLRKNLVSKNYYKPGSPYDLNSDIVTSTLNVLAGTGYDLRGNTSFSLAERIIDNTPLVRIANQRLAVEMGRRVATNLANDFQLNPSAVFDKNPNTKFIVKRDDYSITKKETPQTIVGKIIDAFKTGIGVNDDKIDWLKPDFRVDNGDYYNTLGSMQQRSVDLMGTYNNYGRYGNVRGNNTSPEQNLLINYVDNRTFKKYYSQNIESNVTVDGLLSTNKNIRPETGNQIIDNLASTLYSKDYGRILTQELEFGEGSIPVDKQKDKDGNTIITERRNGAYRGEFNLDKANSIIWGDETTYKDLLVGKRGLLNYTKNILKTNSQITEIMNQKNASYSSGNTLLYKGVECRSWTVNDKYGSFNSLIRNQGNGVRYSVLEKADDVGNQHQYPRFGDTQEDKKRYMFSIENLAWNDEDFKNMNIPDCEIGYNGGRLMWFPFYGVEFSETLRGEYDETKFIGRIEPVYSYAGASRSATLKFTLIMDYPLALRGLDNNELSAYFKGCLEDGFIVPKIEYTKKVTNTSTEVTGTTTVTKEVPRNISTPNNPLLYYFDNDIHVIEDDYEFNITINDQRNLFALNSSGETNGVYYYDRLDEWGSFVGSNDGEFYNYEINGYASQLTTNTYNASLGFRRSYNLMMALINKANSLGPNKIDLVSPDNFNDASFVYYKDKDGKLKKTNESDLTKLKFVFKDINRNIEFTLISNGEKLASSQGVSKENMYQLNPKQDRRAEFSKVLNSNKKKPVNIINEEQITTTQIQNQTVQFGTLDSKDTFHDYFPCHPFGKSFNNENPLPPIDFAKVDYFRPAYHSQTPEDFHKRLTFIQQLVRPGSTIKSSGNPGTNSIFGKNPVSILRLGDFIHTKIIIKDINIDYNPNNWDLNPEGMGVQPMVANVSMSIEVIGGQSLETHIDRLQRAVDFNFYSNSTFFGEGYYKRTKDNGNIESPWEFQKQQISLDEKRKK